MNKIGILGAGTWGCALAILLANNGHEVTIWSAIEREIKALEEDRKVVLNLPGAVMPDSVKLTLDLKEVCTDKDILVSAVASPFVREVAGKIKPFIKDGQIIVNVGKGIEEGTLLTLTEIISEVIPNVVPAVLSGPSHAEEVSRGIPTTCVVGASTKEAARLIQDTFMTDVFRVYTSPDVIGIELGGSLKNVIALAAGIADGLGYGDNTKAALMTRGMAEIGRLGIKMGGKLETFSGLSGVGDLFVTCASVHSRNRKAGYYIGKGMTVDEAMKEVNQVVEGVYSAKAALELSQKFDVKMPIVEQINEILFHHKPAKTAVYDLLLRDKCKEYSTLTWE